MSCFKNVKKRFTEDDMSGFAHCKTVVEPDEVWPPMRGVAGKILLAADEDVCYILAHTVRFHHPGVTYIQIRAIT